MNWGVGLRILRAFLKWPPPPTGSKLSIDRGPVKEEESTYVPYTEFQKPYSCRYFTQSFSEMVRRGGGGPCVLMYQTIEVQPGVYMNVYRSGHGHHQTN